MPAPTEARSPRAQLPRAPAEKPFPPTITYRALEGQPRVVQVVVATAVLPLEVAVSTVRVLHGLEAVLTETAAHLRALRPAVTAASDAYAAGQFDPVFRAIDRLQQGPDVFAVVWAPVATVREVIAPTRARPPEPAVVVEEVDEEVDERRAWFSWPVRSFRR